MKKFIFMFVALFTMAMYVNAQNHPGTSKFTDNWSVTLQGGTLTTFNNFYSGHTACAPIVVVGADKYVNPWLGFGVDARTLIGTGHGMYNTHTAFDAVNVSGVAKCNVRNLFAFNGTRRGFEPVLYLNLGWGHQTCSEGNPRNYMIFRSGVECNFNLGKTRDWAIVVNPSVIWGDINNMKLDKRKGNFELTAGVVYHFKTSNGTNHFTYPTPPEPIIKTVIREVPAREIIRIIEKKTLNDFYRIGFELNSSNLSEEGKKILDGVPAGSTVMVYASTSPEGSEKRNKVLVQERAVAVANYLTSRGVKALTAPAEESRQAIVIVQK